MKKKIINGIMMVALVAADRCPAGPSDGSGEQVW